MRKQTKLVAVLSTAALLAIGASMTSFAATGWAEEDGTWVYYDRDGERATDKWAKSGNNWYYLDDAGEMAIDQLIEDDDNYYYVDINGVMVNNQWVAIDNEDAGNDNEPDQWWYYFQANGKALKGPDDGKISLKSINGKKYAFTDEGKMLYGWVKEDDQSIYNDDDDAWKEAVYYFGDQNDGAMTTGWLITDISDDQADDNNQHWIAPEFTDDEDQSRWFYFKSNGKKVVAGSEDTVKEKTINGKKYGFDVDGRMVAEWSYDSDKSGGIPIASATEDNKASAPNAEQSRQWKYFNSVEDGHRLAKGWFKVVPAEYLNQGKYDDDEDKWFYTDGNGYLYANEFKTIKGKKYGFDKYGRMLDGMHFIQATGENSTSELGAIAADDDTVNFDNEDDFDLHSMQYAARGYMCYYFGDESDGAMKTGKNSVEIDGDKFSFYFSKSGSVKGAGKTGEDDKKYYNSGKLMAAGKDEKFQVIKPVMGDDELVDSALTDTVTAADTDVVGYKKYDDAAQFAGIVDGLTDYVVFDQSDLDKAFENTNGTYRASADLSKGDVTLKGVKLSDLGLSASKLKDDKIGELAIFAHKEGEGANSKWVLGLPTIKNGGFAVVNTSGKISENNSKNKDGNDVYYKLKNDRIVSTYTED